MTVDTFKPTFIIQVEGQTLASDITHEVTSLVFEDNEKEMDVLALSISNRNLQFVDHPLFQEGNEIVARFGYVNNLTPRKMTVIKDIDYDFPENGAPTIRIKAYDKGYKLAGKETQKVWQKPAPGILYSEIAEEIARANELTPKVTPTIGRHLRVVQSNVSDAQFLKELARKSRDKDVKQMFDYAKLIEPFEKGGIGIYPDQKFIHVDVRRRQARWARVNGKYLSLENTSVERCKTWVILNRFSIS